MRVHGLSVRSLIAVLGVAASTACYEGIDPSQWYADGGYVTLGETGDTGEAGSSIGSGDGDGDPGDGDPGDGDPTNGDGDGDGDPTDDPTTTTSGDGDGDGDPDPTDDPTTTTTTTSGDGDGDPEPLPNNAYCDPVSNWDPDWIASELEVVDLVNAARSQGGNCGSQGNFPPSGPLTWHPALTCAARVHSKDMADNNYFSHTNLQGNGPGWRLGQAGYNGGGWGENIAAGYGDPQAVVQGWLDSDGHCANMLNPDFSRIGVGYAYGVGQYGHYWTQTFGN